MSDGAIGSAPAAGNPASDGAAGNGAISQSTDNTPAPAAAPAPGNWYDGIQDQDLLGYVQNKGWKDPMELANGYRNLEKLVGVDKLPMPKDDADAEGWQRVYDRLGRPSSAEDYKLPVPDGDSGEFAKAAAGKFHELGLSGKQAQELANWWNSTQQEKMQGLAQQQQQQADAELGELQKEWGQAYEENVELGRRAAREYGLNADTLGKIEGAIGTKGLMELMAKIGRSQGEASFVQGDAPGKGGFGMTPAAAQQRIAALKADPSWTAKYLNNDVDAKGEMARLMSLAYPE